MADNYDRVPRWGVRTSVERIIRDVAGARQSIAALLSLRDTVEIPDQEYTLRKTDANKVLKITNDDLVTITVPPGVFREGTTIYIEQWGIGTLEVAGERHGDTEVQVNAVGNSPVLSEQFATASLRYDGNADGVDTWIMYIPPPPPSSPIP